MLTDNEKSELRRQVETMSDEELHEYVDSFKKNSELSRNIRTYFRNIFDKYVPGMFKIKTLSLYDFVIMCLDLTDESKYHIKLSYRILDQNLYIKNDFAIPNIQYRDDKTKKCTLTFLDAYFAIISNQDMLNEIRIGFINYHKAHKRLDYVQEYAKNIIRQRKYTAQMMLAC